MRFKLPFNLTNQKPDQDFVQFVSSVFGLINTILNGEIGLVDNCKTGFVSVNFITANVSQAVPHGLGKLPNGFFVVDNLSNVAGVVTRDFSKTSTAQYLYLEASVAGKYKIMIF